MLNDLTDLQSSDEEVWNIDVCFEITTRSEDDSELVERRYTYRYAPEFEKWMFQDFHERITPDSIAISNRSWQRSRDVHWDTTETPTIDVPPEVTDALHEATGGTPITLQTPAGSVGDYTFEEVASNE